jgi:hypothetical protein
MMFLREPLKDSELSPHLNDNLDTQEYLKNAAGNKNFTRLFREYLLKIREKQNAAKKRPYKSFPPKSLILVKDFRNKIHKKIKPIYYKAPQQVVAEFRCTVYASDLAGRIRKQSKNNIKLASPRTIELFHLLPEEIKLIIGDTLNTERWEQIKESGIMPEYLHDIDLFEDKPMITRGTIPLDTHLMEQTSEIEKDRLERQDRIDLDIDEEINNLRDTINSDTLVQLKGLHTAGKLIDDSITLEKISQLYNDMNLVSLNEDALLDELPEINEMEAEQKPESPQIKVDHQGDVHTDNILPLGTKRRIRFNLPALVQR